MPAVFTEAAKEKLYVLRTDRVTLRGFFHTRVVGVVVVIDVDDDVELLLLQDGRRGLGRDLGLLDLLVRDFVLGDGSF